MSERTGRSRTRRVRAERRDLVPVKTTSRPQWPLESQSARVRHLATRSVRRYGRRLRRYRRELVSLAIVGAALLVIVPFGLWARYRHDYVVSRNAIVKGSISNIGVQLKGVVTSIDVQAGDRVRAGQVVAHLEDRQLQAKVQQARSQLEKSARELDVERLAISYERRRLGSHVSEASARFAAAGAQVAAAKSRADDARERHELRVKLARERVITQEELREAEAARRTAEAMLANAQAEREALRANSSSASVDSEGLAVREQHVHVLEAEVEGYRAELAAAEADLKATQILAPDDGWVVRRIVEPGGSVDVGQPVVALWIGGDVWVEAWIDESDLAQVGVGNNVRVTLKPYPDRVFAGTVETVGVSTDFEMPDAIVPQPRHARMRSSPVVCIRVRLDNPEGLFPGLSAVVGIRKRPGSKLAAREPAVAPLAATP